jgi:hypothetical protein
VAPEEVQNAQFDSSERFSGIRAEHNASELLGRYIGDEMGSL